MFTAADVSVVIPSFNSRTTIQDCLVSLQRQRSAPREIILIDSSTDDTVEFVGSHFPQVQISQVPGRIFPGPARNQGVYQASGAIIAFIDSDCIARPNWVERIVAGHNAGYRVVGGAVEVANPNSAIAWAGHLGEFRQFLPVGKPRLVQHIPTCNISYHCELFDTYGGFPDAYYPQEDLLFNYLLHTKGVSILFDPGLRVAHSYRQTLREFLTHQHRIGRVTRSTLRRIEQPGSAIARKPWLAWTASPFLGLVKFLRTMTTLALRFPGLMARQPALVPLLALGSIWWARGFAASARRGLSGIPGLKDPDEIIFSQLPVQSSKR